MYNVYVINSSSKGNCIYVDTGDCKFLLDAGVSPKKTKQILRKKKLKLSSIDYIFCSHSHGDHIDGIKGIAEPYNIPVICNSRTAISLEIPSALIRIVKHGDVVELDNLKVTIRDVPHDVPNISFSFVNSVGETMLYLTDCGTDEFMMFEENEFYIIEANYSKKKMEENVLNNTLDLSRYHRAQTGLGHLEIGQTINILKDSIGDSTKQIILSHLSSQNGNKDEFADRAKKELAFENIVVAEPELYVEFGQNPKIF